jgi:hypothetical protein
LTGHPFKLIFTTGMAQLKMTYIKIKTHKFEMLAEKMNNAYKFLLILVNMTGLISKPTYICHSTNCLCAIYEGHSSLTGTWDF